MKKFTWKWKVVVAMLLWCVAGVMDYGMYMVHAEKYGDYEYTVFDDDTVEISGYNGLETVIEIPSEIDGKSVTSIGYEAFGGCSSLNSITIPSSVTSIGEYAFWLCSNLSSITIPESVTYIGVGAFGACDNIISIKVDTKNEIYDSREDCNAIIEKSTGTLITGCTMTTIPSSVTSIGNCAFCGCSKLSSITIPESVTSIGYDAFWCCSSLSSITIPESVTSIGIYAFAGCSNLNSIAIPEGVTSLKYKVFAACSSLSSITIPESVTSIESDAFAGCSSLNSITIPESVTSIGYGAFGSCSSLNNITVNIGNKIYDSRNNCNAIIETSTKTLIRGCNKTIIPEGVTSIEDEAFSSCNSLSSIKIPSSVTNIGEDAFENCSSLNSITVDVGNEVYDSRENCNAIIETESNTLILGCKNTKIPDGVASIEGGAFCGCSSLGNITIPASVTSIGYGAFENCSSLNSITVDVGNEVYDSRENCNAIIETESNTLILGCKNTKIPDGVENIGRGAFYGCSNLDNITIPTSVTSIGNAAFRLCSSLGNITIPASVTDIDDYAFSDCPETMIIFAESGSYAEKWAKDNGFTVKPLNNTSESTEGTDNPVLPKDDDKTQPASPSNTVPANDPPANTPAPKGSVLTIAGLKCKIKVVSNNANNPTVEYTGITDKKSTKVKIPDTVTVDNVTYKVTGVANNAFSGNKKITTVTVGKNVTSIGKNAFKNCTKLKSVNIQSTTLNKIGANAFSGDKKLTKITLKTTKLTKNSVGKNALKGTSKNLVVKVPKKKVSAYKKYFKGKGNKTVKVKK